MLTQPSGDNEQDIERAIGEVTRMNQIDRDQLEKRLKPKVVGVIIGTAPNSAAKESPDSI